METTGSAWWQGECSRRPGREAGRQAAPASVVLSVSALAPAPLRPGCADRHFTCSAPWAGKVCRGLLDVLPSCPPGVPFDCLVTHPPCTRASCSSIPVRFKEGVPGPEGVEVLLISSRRGKGDVFPKGGWEVDEELREAALRETVEEAGVRGELEVGGITTAGDG